jgi:LCP family protein required for cell wall assembly
MRASFGRLDRLTQIVLSAFVLAGIVSAVVAFNMARGFVVSTTSFQLPGLAVNQGSGETNAEGVPLEPAPAQQLAPQLEPWDGSTRVNILLMGLDHRDWEAGTGAPRTDSMMVFTFDPVTKTSGMLSVPRDLWVEIPGFGHDKINNAYALGEGSRLPGGGAGLAVKTVEQFLGITINYYAQVDFGAFEEFIDTIGGVKIIVEQRVKIQIIGEDKERVIEPGRQVLNGAYALGYARARHTADGDFDRARRQQQIILGIRQQLLRDEVRTLLITQGFQIYQQLSSGVNTNMTIDEMFRLAFSMKDIDPSEIVQAVIAPPDYVTLDTSPDGLSILKPLTENIRLLRDQVFASGTVRSNLANSTEAGELMKMEAAQVAIYNGASVAGIADTTRAYLEAQGVIVASTGNHEGVGATRLIDYTGNPYTLQYLANLMGVTTANIFYRYDPNSAIDVEVIIGPEWVVPQ